MTGPDDRPRPSRDREDRLADYRAGLLSAEDRLAYEREVLADDDLSEALYADVSLAGELEDIAANAGRSGAIVPLPRRRRWLRVVAPLAAAAGLLLVLVARERRGEPSSAPPTFRAPDAAARIVRPLGDLDAAPSRFVWTRDDLAAMYRFELYDDATRLVHQATTGDTTFTPPEGALPAEAFEGYWKVVPMNDAGIERPAPPPAWIRW